MITAIIREIELRADGFNDTPLETIYFGGGTPSLLESSEIESILNGVSKYFNIAQNAEITLEANPDDIELNSLQSLKKIGINRFSLGVQSFNDEDLKWMHRAHNAKESLMSIELIKSAGFDNFSIDLIFGSPPTTDYIWKKNLEIAIQLNTPHLSCYGLTVEPNTALKKHIETGISKAVDQTHQSLQFSHAMDFLSEAGYDHYEISNYALPGREAVHNTNYWKNKKYLGVGPSAHSFDGVNRLWNLKNNSKYISAINDNQLPLFAESLSANDRYNEYIMTGLRTKWGVELKEIDSKGDSYSKHFSLEIQKFVLDGSVILKNGNYKLSPKGKLFADHISSELFYV